MKIIERKNKYIRQRNMEQEDFINQILNSANGIVKTVPCENLFLKIESRINGKKLVPIRSIWIVAASITILLLLNIYLLQSGSKSNLENSEFFKTIDKSNQIY